MADGLKNKAIVITGASSGFGKGAALAFAESGAALVLAARRGELLDELERECRSKGGGAIAVPTDVAVASDVEALAEAALAEYGRIDVWINNAGAGALGRFEEVPLADHVKVIETDLLGTLYGSYFAMRRFRQQQAGVLINVSSVLGKVPAPYYASYAAAKHGVVGLSAALRQELEQNQVENIRVCTVLPTSTDTPFFEHAANYTGHEVTPIPPVYDADDVVKVLVRLAVHPEDEVAVGAAAKAAAIGHQIAPGLTEKMMGRQAHKTQMENAPPAEDTPGGVQEPVEKGSGVSDGRPLRS